MALSTAMPPVHQFVWRDYSLPYYKGIVLTVNTFQGIILFAFFAVLLTYTQTRCWALLTTSGLRTQGSIHLPFPPNHPRHPDSIQKLGQVTAVKALFRPSDSLHHLTMSTIPKRFGYAAFTNAAIYFTLGVFMPLYLTGYLSTAVVQSKFTDSCVGHEDRMWSKRYTAQLADSFFKRCISIPSDVAPLCSQESGIVGNIPEIQSEGDAECPFSKDVCQEATQPLRIGFLGLGPRDYGVNLNQPVSVDHRVTCAPLKTELFLYPIPLSFDGGRWANGSLLWFGRPFNDPNAKVNRTAIYGMILETRNGPNSYTGEFSGNVMASFRRPNPAYSFDIYPTPNAKDPNEEIDPRLRRDDGHVFIVVLRAGRSLYAQQMDDPFYAAHNKVDNSYVPDYEATAIGCVEQFRYCLTDGESFCTTWATSLEVFRQLLDVRHPKSTVGEETLLDLAFIYIWFTSMASVKRYLDLRPGTQALFSTLFRVGDTIDMPGPTYPWTAEVLTWFTTAFINSRYSLLQIVRRNGPNRAENAPKSMIKLCRIILFQSNEHINVDFVGLMASLSALFLICAASHRDKIYRVLRRVAILIGKGLKNLFWVFQSLYNRAKVVYQEFVLRREQRRAQFPVSSWRSHSRGTRILNDNIELSSRNNISIGSTP